MDLYSSGQKNSQQLFVIIAVLVVVVIIGLIIYWFINNNRGVVPLSVGKKAESEKVPAVASPLKKKQKQTLSNNATPVVVVNDQKFIDEATATAFINNTEAAVGLLTQYADTLEQDAALIDVDYWKKDAKKHFDKNLKEARETLAEILVHWQQLREYLADPTKHKYVYKLSSNIEDEVGDVYNDLNDAQEDLLGPYRQIFNEYGKFSKNKSEAVYLEKVAPVVTALNSEVNLHRAIVPTSPADVAAEKLAYIVVPYEEAAALVNTLNATAEAKIKSIEKFYEKLEKNFKSWKKVNIKDNIIKNYK